MDLARMTAELERDEGLRLKPYRCTAGRLTIGIGRNLDDRGITEAEARYLLANDIAAVTADLDREFPWWRELAEARQRVLVNMCFNLGIERLRKFKNTLSLINLGRYKEASASMLDSLWARQVGPRAQRLARMMDLGTDAP